MSELLAAFLIVFTLGALSTIALLCTRIQARAHTDAWSEQRRALAQAQAHERELDPRYQAKVEADRRFWLAVQEMELKRVRIEVPQHGIYIVDADPARMMHLAPIHKPLQIGKAEAAPATVQVARPSQEAILEQLPYNQYVVSPGVNADTGEIVLVNLLEVPHVKFIGAPGFGKSCLAASVLDQLSQTNDTRHVQLALLDCEHKTSRLFEQNENIARVNVGGCLIDLVATHADMVAVQLGFLKREMMRRAELSESELDRQPVIIMYVEEMLSLQYEVDPKLLQQMVDDILILAVRARKYRMFLLSCMQTDYSTTEMKVSQKMYRFRGAAAIDPTAARAAGFQNTDLVKANFASGQKGQFVIEYPGFSNIVLVASYDVKRKLQQLERSAFPQRETDGNGWETRNEADSHSITDAFPVSTVEGTLSTKIDTSGVSSEIRETIRRMAKRGQAHRDIAYDVGLYGRKYALYRQVCQEEGIGIEQAEEEA